MGFVSFVKKLFGAKTEVSETSQLGQEFQPVVINPTTEVVETLPPPVEEIVVSESLVESQITDAVTTPTPTEDIVETVKSNKKVVIKKRTYKPKTEVTKKSIPSNRKRVSNHGKGK